jgi:archaellum component FlaG (FlaF/FlaG flagellin family)
VAVKRKTGLRNSKKGFEAASTLIMFIAVIGLSTALVISFKNYVSDTQQSFSVQNDITSNKLKSSISISNVYYNTTSNEVVTYVKNIGQVKLTTQNFDYFIDDEYQTDFDVPPADNLNAANQTIQNIGDTVAVIKVKVLAAGTHEVRVVTEYGTGDSDTFNI